MHDHLTDLLNRPTRIVRADDVDDVLALLLPSVVTRAVEIADDRRRRVEAARFADRLDLLAFAAGRGPSLLDFVESCDADGIPTLSLDAPDVCEND